MRSATQLELVEPAGTRIVSVVCRRGVHSYYLLFVVVLLSYYMLLHIQLFEFIQL